MSERNGILLSCEDLHVEVEGQEIVKGLSLAVREGEKHAIMGPNGSGKSTFSNALMGHPSYRITNGKIILNGEEVTNLAPDERARRGIFLAFQYPVAIPGVSVANFLRAAVKAVRGKEVPVLQFRKELYEQFDLLGIDHSFATRYVNDGFSGGEKKRLEILQMALLNPRLAILDETDSGLDIDALRTVSEGINRVCGDKVGVIVVTHYQRLLNYVNPDRVHVLKDGRLVRSGGSELALELEAHGYELFGESTGRTNGRKESQS
ncbi:MAG: Fe-S cluster assembly ATPase SufC [Candidatus Glassbacteria bacterium RBG_16_58_8]|uniref:Fe-S cluster assembly ATPase SufC n=1 Tax=Candidatus Glassbacteria bacterium RBG_16_58_8 TaxID=1817866 RepID=A0A1F5YC56_9BACT|nr:MAG: Fe-S cluster assembly ATPase SufC [Candidatus Glassbacteria bacterium RBG_16_58_8]